MNSKILTFCDFFVSLSRKYQWYVTNKALDDTVNLIFPSWMRKDRWKGNWKQCHPQGCLEGSQVGHDSWYPSLWASGSLSNGISPPSQGSCDDCESWPYTAPVLSAQPVVLLVLKLGLLKDRWTLMAVKNVFNFFFLNFSLFFLWFPVIYLTWSWEKKTQGGRR